MIKLVKSLFMTGAVALAVMLTHVASAVAQVQDVAPTELPEPSTLGLVAIGVIGVLAVSRLRK